MPVMLLHASIVKKEVIALLAPPSKRHALLAPSVCFLYCFVALCRFFSRLLQSFFSFLYFSTLHCLVFPFEQVRHRVLVPLPSVLSALPAVLVSALALTVNKLPSPPSVRSATTAPLARCPSLPSLVEQDGSARRRVCNTSGSARNAWPDKSAKRVAPALAAPPRTPLVMSTDTAHLVLKASPDK